MTMSYVGLQSRSAIFRRMCVRCGFDGADLTRPCPVETLPACPRCGCDFEARPPLSYADMEGFRTLPLDDSDPSSTGAASILTPGMHRLGGPGFQGIAGCDSRRDRNVRRWLAAGFVMLVSLVIGGQLGYMIWCAMQ